MICYPQIMHERCYSVFAEAEIGELDVTLAIEQYIVWLKVAMDVVHRMDAFHGHDLRLGF